MSENELCECCGVRDADKSHYLTSLGSHVSYSNECWREFDVARPMSERVAGGSFESAVKFSEKIRDRRAMVAAAKNLLSEERRFYGTRPDVLPETLPAGTKLTNGQFDEAYSVLRMTTGSTYEGWFRARKIIETATVHCSAIDWSSVPVQEPEPKRDTIPAPTVFEKQEEVMFAGASNFGVDLAAGPSWGDITLGGVRWPGMARIKEPECRECSRPERPVKATHGELCVYCDKRDRRDDFETQCAMWNPGARAAQARMDAADKRNAPRVTADSKMLALPHPWECDESEP